MSSIQKKVKKRKKSKRKSEKKRFFDTSKPQAKFRRARIDWERGTEFDENRDLDFNWDRDIDARLQGIVFREKGSIGFRNLGVTNLDDVLDDEDWPDYGEAKPGKKFKKERIKDYTKRWGKDLSYDERWGVDIPLEQQPKAMISHHKYSFDNIVRDEIGREGRSKKSRAVKLNDYGLSLMEEGDYLSALEYFKKAIDLDPEEKVYKKNLNRCRLWWRYTSRGGGKK